MDKLLMRLESFYLNLDEVLRPSSRDCGVCGKCCKAASKLRVYPPEMENIKRQVKNKVLFKKFHDFAANEAVKIWGNTDGYCPFQEGALCLIYPVRPYHCRIYGHYVYPGATILEGCVYQGQAIVYHRREELPLIAQLDRLTADFTKARANSEKQIPGIKQAKYSP